MTTKQSEVRRKMLKLAFRFMNEEYWVDHTGTHWEWNGVRFVHVPFEVDDFLRYSSQESKARQC